MDSKARSLVKAVIWRIVAFLVLGAVSYAFTRSFTKTSEITVVYSVVQLLVYWLHERAWEAIRWGRLLHPLACLPVERPLEAEDVEKLRRRLKELGYL